jgi:hypothetical protein
LGASLCGTAIADGATLLRPLTVKEETASFTREEHSRIATIRGRPTTLRATVVAFDRNALNSNIVNLIVPSGAVLSFTKVSAETTEVNELKFGLLPIKHQVFTWFGRAANGGEAVFSISDDGATGQINAPGQGILELGTVNKSYWIITEFDPSKRAERYDDVAGGDKK